MLGKMSLPEGLLHGCLLTFLDCLGTNEALKTNSIQYLKTHLETFGGSNVDFEYKAFQKTPDRVGSDPFYIPIGTNPKINFYKQRPSELCSIGPNGNSESSSLKYNAPTTLANVAKVLRGMQTGKAILMEGSPGVGKTSLIEALAKDAGFVI